MGKAYSWGNLPRVDQEVVAYHWRDQLLPLGDGKLLAYGLGRSYGDSCLNAGHKILATRRLDRLIDFDSTRGVLRCEAGVSLAEILEFAVPRGWFLPVTPGTKFVTVGGAIANDVHGKNHHSAGTFGHWVDDLELLRSDAGLVRCSEGGNANLLRATIGGLGLTGLILTATIRLKRIQSPWIECETIKFRGLSEFKALSESSATSHEYIVAWFDCMTGKADDVRGLFSRGNHSVDLHRRARPSRKRLLTVPFVMPSALMDPVFVRAFNALLFQKQVRSRVQAAVHFDQFLYPLDSMRHWNRIYGKSGFFQYQCVVPMANYGAVGELLAQISKAGVGSFLAVLKQFGDMPSRGLLSFPRPGVTIALDFPNRGAATLKLFDEFDRVVVASGGAIYPAKDARMPASVFQASYPKWKEFSTCVDPRFSSSFWRRVSSGSEASA